MAPLVREPLDLEDFSFDLHGRVRSSTAQNLVCIHGFQPHSNEGLERRFERFNLITRPLEEGNPPTITANQITTHYVHHLETVLKVDDFKELERHIRNPERIKAANGKRPLN